MRFTNWKALLLTSVLFANVSVRADDYFVDPTGVNGAYRSIQAALDAAPAGTATNRTNIFIAPGRYLEEAKSSQLQIRKPYTSLVGTGDAPEDVIIESSLQGLNGATRVFDSANDFMATNLTFNNLQPDNSGVAVALRSSADRSAFKNVRIMGFQDTLLVDNKTRQYFVDSYVTGDTDFIFGNATVVFEKCMINSSDGGHLTAAETFPDTAIGLVFLDSTLTRTGAGNGSTSLGRPWHWPASEGGTKASVTYINVKMDTHVKTSGWDPWNGAGGIAMSPDPDGATRYSEFNTMDLAGNPLAMNVDGLPNGRVRWADPMTAEQAAAYTLKNLFGGPEFWNQNPHLQPEYVGGAGGYTHQKGVRPWDPLQSLAQLPNVPEPSTSALLGLIVIPFGLARRRSRPTHCLIQEVI